MGLVEICISVMYASTTVLCYYDMQNITDNLNQRLTVGDVITITGGVLVLSCIIHIVFSIVDGMLNFGPENIRNEEEEQAQAEK